MITNEIFQLFSFTIFKAGVTVCEGFILANNQFCNGPNCAKETNMARDADDDDDYSPAGVV